MGWGAEPGGRSRAFRRSQKQKAVHRVYERLRSGRWHYFFNHLESWQERHERRLSLARRVADQGVICSCWRCGNPRRYHRDATLQEMKWEDSGRAQLEEIGLSCRLSRFRRWV